MQPAPMTAVQGSHLLVLANHLPSPRSKAKSSHAWEGEKEFCAFITYTPPRTPYPPSTPHPCWDAYSSFLSFFVFMCSHEKKNGQCLQVPNPIPQSPSDLVSCNLHPIKYWAKAFLNIRAKVPKWECVNTTSRNF